MAERREKRAWLDYNELSQLFIGRPGGHLLAYAVVDLPEGTQVARVVPDEPRGGVVVYFTHPDFEPLAHMEEPPWVLVSGSIWHMPEPHPTDERDNIVERYARHAIRRYRDGQIPAETLAELDVV